MSNLSTGAWSCRVVLLGLWCWCFARVLMHRPQRPVVPEYHLSIFHALATYEGRVRAKRRNPVLRRSIQAVAAADEPSVGQGRSHSNNRGRRRRSDVQD